ncbi:MAG: TonB-dependent receptor [Marinoscillum sp.]
MENRLRFFNPQVIISMLLMVLSLYAYAQEKMVISGTVLDDTGEPIPGVSIIAKGTNLGTTTDFEGLYRLEIPAATQTLVFSFVGFVTQEINIGSQTRIDVKMQMDIAELAEVVVIGYGSIEKKDVTGAMTTVTPKDFNKGVMTNPTELLQGRVSGVNITPSSGEPGAAVSVNIRGANSIRSSNQPLYVIDGVPLSGGNTTEGGSGTGDTGGSQAKNPLNFLNPDDIASIDILKDASATAIYGSRGANGVVIITTKRGKSGQGNVSYSTYVSASQVRKKMDVLSAIDWRKARIGLYQETGNDGYLDFDFGATTDWQDEIFRTAITQNHSLSFSGGSEKGNYRASIGYLNQDGIVETSNLNRYTARLNLSQKLLNDKLSMSMNLTATNTKDRTPPIGDGGGHLGDALVNAIRANPTMPVKTDDGEYFQFATSDRNPVAMINLMDDRSTTDRYLGNVTGDLEIVKGLHLNFNYGLDRSTSTRNANYSNRLVYITPDGQAEVRDLYTHSDLMEVYLKYNTSVGAHSFDVLGGYAYQYFERRGKGITALGYTNNLLLYTNSLGARVSDVPVGLYSWGDISELQSYFGRVNYSYDNKYLATFTLRADGSSKFGPNNRYGIFPSAAVSWRLSEEDFLKSNTTVSNLKFRLGFGKTGNQEIPNYAYFPQYQAVSYDLNGETLLSIRTARTSNPNLQWETSVQYNAGLDFGFFNDRVEGTMDYFYKTTSNLLYNTPTGGVAFTTNFWQNLDTEIINNGIELAVTGHLMTTKNFDWSTTVIFTKIDNKVKGFEYAAIQTGRLNGPGMTNVYIQVIEDGAGLHAFNLRQFEGYDSEGYSIYANEGQLSLTGSPYPDFTLGLSNSITYRGFDLDFFLDSKVGQDVYNNTANSLINKPALAQAKNISYDELYAQRSIEDGEVPSTKYLEDASFLRVSNVTLGYNFPVTGIDWISSAKIYVTGQNLYVMTNYTGYDPEVNTNKAVGDIPSFGIDYSSYPRPRTILVGMNLNF